MENWKMILFHFFVSFHFITIQKTWEQLSLGRVFILCNDIFLSWFPSFFSVQNYSSSR